MLDLGKCPDCLRREVRLSSRWWQHAARLIAGSRRRYCAACGRRWLSDLHAGGVPRAWLALAAAAALIWWQFASVARRTWELRSGRAPSAASARGPGGGASAGGLRDAPQGGSDLVSAFWQALAEEQGRRQAEAAAERRSRGSAAATLAADPTAGAAGLAELMRRMIKHASEGQLDQIDKMDKKQLWEQYGHYFGSKQEAQQAYDEYKRQRANDLKNR